MRRILVFALLFTSLALHAQTITGTISGSVSDSSGLPLVGANVTLLQPDTGAVRSLNSDERGGFAFSSVQPANYELHVEHTGFKKFVKSGIALSASETLSVGELRLQVGSVEQSVTVTAEAATVQTSSGEHAGLITARQVEGMLNLSRSVMSLLQLLPGVVDNNEGTADRMTVGFNLNVQGNRNNANNYNLDGMSLNAIGDNTSSVVNVSQDSVAEVKVLLSNYSAEYGRMSGANVQIVTKSGTKQFHGSGSHFWRHEQFNATDFFNNRFGLPKPLYRYKTWTYNVGGPVYIPGKFNTKREKLFFFWTQEYWPLRQSTPIGQLTVPTELERNGDFSQSVDLNNRLITVRDPLTQTPLPGNRLPASRIDPNGQALLNVLPAPNFFDRGISGGRYNYVFQSELRSPQRIETLKLDYYLNPRNILTGTFSQYSSTQEGYLASRTANWPQMLDRYELRGKVYSARYQRIISPTTVNEANVGYSRRPTYESPSTPEQLQKSQRDTVGFTAGQLYPEVNPLNIIPNATFPGVTQAATIAIWNRFPLNSTLSTISVADNLTKVVGTHSLKFGIYADRFWTANPAPMAFNGMLNFSSADANNPLNTGYAYANAAAGVFTSYSEISARPIPELAVSNIEWFAQDNWKVNRRFTLDYGMRFAWIQPVTQQEGKVSGFDPARFDPGSQPLLIRPAIVDGRRSGVHPTTGQVYPAVLIGAIAPGTGDPANGMVVPANEGDYPESLVNNRGIHFAPRFGFAYDPFGQGNTAIRGGVGVFYNRTPTVNTLYNVVAQPPIAYTQSIFYGTLPTLLSSSGFIFPNAVIGLDRVGKVPTTINFSLKVSQRIVSATVVNVGYVGSLGRHLMWQRDLNAIPLGATFDPANTDPTNRNVALPAAFLRPIQGFNAINYREWAGTSNYHSLQATVDRRVRDLQLGVAWTWSKSMDYVSVDNGAVTSLVSPRVYNYGLSTFDRTHIFKAYWVWDLPTFPLKRIAGAVLNGWQLSGIASFTSGAPLPVTFSTTVPIDITGTASLTPRPDVIGNPVLSKSERSFSENFRTDVFRLPARGTIGTAARTVIRGPGINNWNLGLFKNVPLHERVRLQLRAEAFNAFNHTQFSALDTTARFDAAGNQVNARLGEFTDARPPRILQFAVRLYF